MKKKEHSPILFSLVALTAVMVATACGVGSLGATQLPPTATPDDPEQIAAIIADREITGDILNIIYNPTTPALNIYFDMQANHVGVAQRGIGKAFCALRQSGAYPDFIYLFRARGHFVDGFGNPVFEDSLEMRINPPTASRINCDNIDLVNWSAVADHYFVHRLLDT